MSDHVTSYEIVSEHDIKELKAKVNAYISNGWTLYGDLQIVAPVIDGAVAPLYTQVIVKTRL